MRKKQIVALMTAMALGVGSSTFAMTDYVLGQTPKNSVVYTITDENKKETLSMSNQPMSSCWFPEDLLQWDPKTDNDLQYNISRIPLAKRAGKEAMKPVNNTQNMDTKVMAISIMNASTSGNAPRGLNKVESNTFSYWQYVDQLVYWGGSSGEGIIVPLTPDVTDSAHKNGVKVLGTIFFPQNAHGGKIEWLDTFLQKENGEFPIADKLIEVARTYGFDGWFMNQETEKSGDKTLIKEHAILMQQFLIEMKEKAPDLELVYYDSMTKDGKMDWQNALTDKNAMFLQNTDKKSVADSMFLNFWWYSKSYVDQRLLESSKQKANQLGIDPYKLYAGIDVQANGYDTPIRWDLFEDENNKTYTSLGIYCPSWTYFSSANKKEYWEKENKFWVNEQGDPSSNQNLQEMEHTKWRGISTYVTERTAITRTPFVTNFNTGNGYNFFINGKKVSKMNWNDRSLSDIMPTYRFIMKQQGKNDLQATFDMGTAWYGGSSLQFAGNMEKGKKTTVKLYRTDFSLPKNISYTTVAKATANTKLNLVLTFADDTTKVISGNQQLKGNQKWTTITYDVSKFVGKRVREISYQMRKTDGTGSNKIHLGNITVASKNKETVQEVTKVKVDGAAFDEEAMYSGIRLSWKESNHAQNYEIYKVNEDGSRSFLGATNTNCFYINTLKRAVKEKETTFEVIPVTELGKRGGGSEVTVQWPDNSKPKADFKVSKTLIKTGDSVTFTSHCSENTERITWSLEGASKTKATDNKVTVSYPKAGTYSVTLVAKNEVGMVKKEVKGCIVVRDDVPSELALLSKNCNVEASGYVNDNEAPQFAVDGDVTKKWCATGTPPHTLIVDLGSVATVSEVEIFHAKAGGESEDMNTSDYIIAVSEDGTTYYDTVKVTRNTKGQTKDTFAPIKARFVKVIIEKPTQGSDTAARIYEVKVNGMKE